MIPMPMGAQPPEPPKDDDFLGKVMKDPWFRLGMALLKEGGPQDRPHSVGQDIARAVENVQGQMDNDLVREDQRAKMSYARQSQDMALQQLAAIGGMQGMGGAPAQPKAPTTTPVAPLLPPPVAARIDPVANPSSDIKLGFKVPSQYEPMLRRAAQMYNVPYELLAAQAQHESAGTWNPNIKGRMGEVGIPQFMPKTARAYGLIGADGTDRRNDAELSINAQARLMRDNYERGGRDWSQALHLYNASPGNPAGQRYAQKIMALAGMADDQGEGGGASPPAPAAPAGPMQAQDVPPDLKKMFLWQAYSASGGDAAKMVGEYYRLVNGWQSEQQKSTRSSFDATQKVILEDELTRNREREKFERENSSAAARKYDEAMAASDAERFDTMRKSTTQVAQSLDDIAQMKSMLKSGLTTGVTADWQQSWASAIESLTGAKVSDKIGKADFFASLSGQMLKNLRAQMAAQGTKDPNPSNADLMFDQKIIPSMLNSPEGNMLILMQMERKARQALEISQAASDYAATNKRFNSLEFERSDAFKAIMDKYRLKKGDPERMAKVAKQLVGGTPEVSSEEEYNALPSGAVFITPDGRIKRKP